MKRARDSKLNINSAKIAKKAQIIIILSVKNHQKRNPHPRQLIILIILFVNTWLIYAF